MDDVKDYVDWSKVPDWVQFVAVDSEKGVAGFYDNPLRVALAGKLANEKGVGMFDVKPYITKAETYECNSREGLVPATAIIGPLPPWRESLRQRPKKE